MPSLAAPAQYQGARLVVWPMPPQRAHLSQLGGPRVPGWPCCHREGEAAGQAPRMDAAGPAGVLGRVLP
eukprot:586627-Alexandrium_andersonii.AAC.1